MNSRTSIQFGLALAGLARYQLASAHHGWSSFDQTRPVFLSGRAANVRWRNPHVEFTLELDPRLQLPADLADRRLPAQSAQVDGPSVLKRAVLPNRRDPRWDIELAPIFRINQWQIPQIQPGQAVELVGFTFSAEQGSALLRAEYLFLADRVYGLRSSPA